MVLCAACSSRANCQRMRRVTVAALGVCTTLVLSALAWIAWIPVNAAALRPNPFLRVVLLDDLLAALFVSGLVGSFFGMMPIRGLPGMDGQVLEYVGVGGGLRSDSPRTVPTFSFPSGISGHGHRPRVMSIRPVRRVRSPLRRGSTSTSTRKDGVSFMLFELRHPLVGAHASMVRGVRRRNCFGRRNAH